MTKKTRTLRLAASVLLVLTLMSCDRNLIYSDVASMPDNTWNLFDSPDFRFPVADTTLSTNVSFTLRNGSQYPYRNIFLFVTTTSPEGKSITDTLEYKVADDKGKWLGKGFGDIHELVLPFKQNVFFPQKGTYHFKIRHGMRIGDLKGVYDIGLRIEKHQR